MRIPIDSCAGCNLGPEILSFGSHLLPDRTLSKCKFLIAEEECLRGWIVLRVSRYRPVALRYARKENGALHWVGQGPYPMWVVVKENK